MFVKTIFKWREPKAVRRWRYEQVKEALRQKPLWKKSLSPAINSFVVNALLFILGWFGGKMRSLPFMEISVVFAFSFVLLFAAFFFYPWLSSFETASGNIHKGGFLFVRDENDTMGAGTHEIIQCHIESVLTEEGASPVLLVATANDARFIGIPPGKVPQVIEAFAQINIKVERK